MMLKPLPFLWQRNLVTTHNFILYYAWIREDQKFQEDLKMQEYGIFEELM